MDSVDTVIIRQGYLRLKKNILLRIESGEIRLDISDHIKKKLSEKDFLEGFVAGFISLMARLN